MPRKNLIRTNDLPYHVTARSNNQEWFSLPMPVVWKLTLESLKEAYDIHKVDILAFVLMSNHYHLLIRTPEANLDDFMYEFNKRMALRLKATSGHTNHLFGSRYKWCLIKNEKYYWNCFRYIYQNPLRAGVTNRCELYPYSTLHVLNYETFFSVPIADEINAGEKRTLQWLNEKIEDEEAELLKKGLRKSEFVTLKTRMPRKTIESKLP